jgi:AraC family transcriptional activator FtrA
VFVLAATGLNGRKATTHWRYIDALKARYPDIDVVEDVLYQDEGDILTSAGSAAGIDLCLHVVRRDYGMETANSVARRLVIPPHRDGSQPQQLSRPVAQLRESQRLGQLFDFCTRILSRRTASTPGASGRNEPAHLPSSLRGGNGDDARTLVNQ